MANKKNNRSSQRTQRLIREAFVDLAYDRPLSQIAVADVAERADISRGTFYLYFHELLEVRDVIADEFIDAFRDALAAKVAEEDACGEADPLPKLVVCLDFIQEHNKEVTVLLGPNGDIAFLRRIEGVIRRFYLAGIEEHVGAMDEDVFSRLFSFLITGMVGSIRDWLARGCQETSEEMAEFLGTILITTARDFAEGQPARA